jgi:hypothetical protein
MVASDRAEYEPRAERPDLFRGRTLAELDYRAISRTTPSSVDATAVHSRLLTPATARSRRPSPPLDAPATVGLVDGATRRAVLSVILLLAAVAASTAPSPARAACAVVEDPRAELVTQHAHTIFLARVIGPGDGTLMELRVLRTYRGDVPSVVHLEDEAISCYDLSNHIGGRVLVALGREPGWGPFTLGWFETQTNWQHFINDYPTLGALLRAIGVTGDLPDTAAATPDEADPGAPMVPLSVALTAALGAVLGLRVRQRSRG